MNPLKLSFLGLGISCFLFLFILFPRPMFADDCLSAVPDAPNLYQVSPNGTTAIIYFVQPNTSFDSYIVSYGLTQSADAYSTTFPMGTLTGAVKYTINDLFPKTNYFFKVRAVNGCATGAWSSTLSTNIQNSGNLPQTGPNNSLLAFGMGGVLLFFVGVGLLFAI